MTNPNLVPVQVTTKNGVRTTRWKRPAAPSPNAAALPAPSAPERAGAKGDSSPAAVPMEEIIDSCLYDLRGVIPPDVHERLRSELSPETVTVLDSVFGAKPGRIIPFIKNCIHQRSFASLNNAAAFVDLHEQCGDTDERRDDRYLSAVFGLQFHSSTGMKDDDYTRSERVRATGRALLLAAMRLGRPYRAEYSPYRRAEYTDDRERMHYLPSRQLKALIARRPQDVEGIVRVLSERLLPVRTPEDIASLEELLDGAGPAALGNGVL